MEQIASDLKAASGANPTAATLQPDLRQRLLSRIATEGTGSAPTPAAVPTSRVLPLWRRQPVLVFGGSAAFAALFLMVFFPIFAMSREKARQASCASNVNQTGLSLNQYAQDYDERFPAAAAGAAPMAAAAPAAAPPTIDMDRNEGKVAFAGSDSVMSQRAKKSAGESNVSDTSGLPAMSAGPVMNARTAAAPVQTPMQVAQAEQPQMLQQKADPWSTPAHAPAPTADAPATDDGRQVHKEGSITVAVDHLEAASDQVEQMVKAGGGYVAENNLNTDVGGYKAADLTVRVPVAQFEEMMKQIAQLGDVTAKSVSGEDITEKLSDANQATTVLADEVESSAAKLRGFSGPDKERRYREADLRQVKIQLAQEQARLGLLRKMARLATIQVSLTEKAKRAAMAPPPQSGFLADLRATNQAASAAFAAAIRVPVILVIWVLAFSPLWVPLVILYRYAAIKSLARQIAATTIGETKPDTIG